MNIKKNILDVQDFPIKGVTFKDITPILTNPEVFKLVVDNMAEYVIKKGATVIVAPEARGFLFASAVAYKAGVKFVLVRKPGKLPRKTIEVDYQLEYGTNTIQIHKDDLQKTDKVVIIDDVLATGGTIKAIINLLNQQNVQIVGINFLVDLSFLHDNELFKEYDPNILVTY